MSRDDDLPTHVRQALQEQRIKNLEQMVESLIKDRDNALRWGIVILGSAVLGLATWIFNLITGHMK